MYLVQMKQDSKASQLDPKVERCGCYSSIKRRPHAVSDNFS